MKIMYQQINDCSTVKKEQTIIRKWQEWEKKKKSQGGWSHLELSSINREVGLTKCQSDIVRVKQEVLSESSDKGSNVQPSG